MARSWVLALCALALMSGASAQPSAQGVNVRAVLADRPAETLSAYRLFRDAGARQPNELVIPYGLNTELYSDGALKFRYVFVPEGDRATYLEDEVFAFPVGTGLVKTFAFAADMRPPGEDDRLLETRLLVPLPARLPAFGVDDFQRSRGVQRRADENGRHRDREHRDALARRKPTCVFPPQRETTQGRGDEESRREETPRGQSSRSGAGTNGHQSLPRPRGQNPRGKQNER